MKRIWLGIGLAFLTACGGGGGGSSSSTATTHPVSISISPKQLTVTGGETFDFSYSLTVQDGDPSTDFKVRWTCSAGAITQPSSTGLGGHFVAPLASGACTVTVTSLYDQTKKASAQVTVVAPPAITSFTSDALDLDQAASTANLTPIFSGGSGILMPGMVPVQSGQAVAVHPAADTTFTLQVTNAAGTVATRTVDLKVWGSPSISFQSSKTGITIGDPVDLLWNVGGATAVQIQPVVGTVNLFGVTTCYPTGPTTYTLTASNPIYLATRQVDVDVAPLPAISLFQCSPAVIRPGSSSLLSATWSGGTAKITPDPGSLASGGSVTVAPTETTYFTLTVTNIYGRAASAEAILKVATDGSFWGLDNLVKPRMNPLLAPLPGSKVLVAGGGSDLDYSGTPINLQDTAEVVDLATGGVHLLAGHMGWPRGGMTTGQRAVALGDGRVLLVGAGNPEIFDPLLETFRPTLNPMLSLYAIYQSAELPDGQAVLLAGWPERVILFDPASETFSEFPLKVTRRGAGMTVLTDGSVLISGGDLSSLGGYEIVGTCERFDPSLGKVTLLPAQIPYNRWDHQAILESSGLVELWGGSWGYANVSSDPTYSIYGVDPSNGSSTYLRSLPGEWGFIGKSAPDNVMLMGRGTANLFLPTFGLKFPAEDDLHLGLPLQPSVDYCPAIPCTTLPDGRMLFAGGKGEDSSRVVLFDPNRAFVNPYVNHHTMTPVISASQVVGLADGRLLVFDQNSSRLYDPIDGGETPTLHALVHPRTQGSSVLQADGSALLFGGSAYDPATHLNNTVDWVERFDPVGQTWTVLGHLLEPRQDSKSLVLPSGKVLVIGGGDPAGPWGEVFDPATGSSQALTAPPWSQSADTLPALSLDPVGKVVVALASGIGTWDPVNSSWSSGTTLPPSFGTPSIIEILDDGRVMIMGEHTATIWDPVAISFTTTHIGLSWSSGVQAKDTAGNRIVTGIVGNLLDIAFWGISLVDPKTGLGHILPDPPASPIGAYPLPDGRICLVYSNGSDLGYSEILDVSKAHL